MYHLLHIYAFEIIFGPWFNICTWHLQTCSDKRLDSCDHLSYFKYLDTVHFKSLEESSLSLRQTFIQKCENTTQIFILRFAIISIKLVTQSACIKFSINISSLCRIFFGSSSF